MLMQVDISMFSKKDKGKIKECPKNGLSLPDILGGYDF